MSKVIVTSDAEKYGDNIEHVKSFAKSVGIDTILDCGCIHGSIYSSRGSDYPERCIHYDNTEGVVIINPGSLGYWKFAVFDLETKVIEYRSLRNDKIVRIGAGENEDITQIRNIETNKGNAGVMYIARLVNGKEVIVCDGKRSEEYERIEEMYLVPVEADVPKVMPIFKIAHNRMKLLRSLDGYVTEAYDDIQDTPLSIESGKLLFVATRGYSRFVVFGDEELEHHSIHNTQISEVCIVSGQPAYILREKADNIIDDDKEYVCHGREKVGGPFKSITYFEKYSKDGVQWLNEYHGLLTYLVSEYGEEKIYTVKPSRKRKAR
jgi:hypothetical protein